MGVSVTPEMNLPLRACAVAAVLGGALRVADSFLAGMVAVRTLQIAYFVTDVMLLAGLCGIYLGLRRTLGLSGFLGFVAAVTGLLIVRASALIAVSSNSYFIGATVTLIGVVAMGLAMLLRTSFSRVGPVLWIASFALGLIGLASAKLSWTVVWAGVLFGVGFVVVGINLLRPISTASKE
jgi:hypothetical protein